MNPLSTLNDLVARTEKIELAELDAFFDSLPAVELEAMLGDWTGGVFVTGHPGEKQLARLGWDGKTFRGANDVDPIVSRDAEGRRTASDVMGAATLRAVRYRGVVTATMVYDQHPIFDHFRAVDADTVLGVMDRKGDAFPLYFYLRRL
jgi:hypothetical protein